MIESLQTLGAGSKAPSNSSPFSEMEDALRHGPQGRYRRYALQLHRKTLPRYGGQTAGKQAASRAACASTAYPDSANISPSRCSLRIMGVGFLADFRRDRQLLKRHSGKRPRIACGAAAVVGCGADRGRLQPRDDFARSGRHIFRRGQRALVCSATIVVLFFFLSLLEDSGYMARVAFVMDKLLRKIGLSGPQLRAHADRLRVQRSGASWLHAHCPANATAR